MTKTEALYNFFNSFDIPAYPITSVPDEQDINFPYLTYEPYTGYIGDSVSITVNIWYKTESEKVINDKAEEIGSYIGLGGVNVPYNGGCIWITRGKPFSVPMAETDRSYKRRILNVELNF